MLWWNTARTAYAAAVVGFDSIIQKESLPVIAVLYCVGGASPWFPQGSSTLGVWGGQSQWSEPWRRRRSRINRGKTVGNPRDRRHGTTAGMTGLQTGLRDAPNGANFNPNAW